MTRILLILYAVWCLIVVAAFASATNRGYSPFADGGRGGFFFFGGGGHSGSGPRHK